MEVARRAADRLLAGSAVLWASAFVLLRIVVTFTPALADDLDRKAELAIVRALRCWQAAVINLDDGRTPADIVAHAVLSRCAQEVQGVCEAELQAQIAKDRIQTPEATVCAPGSWLQKSTGRITDMVLENRAFSQARIAWDRCVFDAGTKLARSEVAIPIAVEKALSACPWTEGAQALRQMGLASGRVIASYEADARPRIGEFIRDLRQHAAAMKDEAPR
jgi:hypothetical protein